MRFFNTRPLSVVVVVFVFAVVGVRVVGSSAQNSTQPSHSLAKELVSYRDVAKKVLPAVVSVEATTRHASANPGMFRWRDDWRLPQEFRKFFEDFAAETEWPEPLRQGMGSGFIIDPSGVVVTNHHVVKGATEVTVRLQDGRQFTATDLKSDPKTDLAVIRFDAKSELPYLEFTDSAAVEIGDRVLAVGAPFGFSGSVSAGIISGKGRKLSNTIYEDFLQTDAAINPGNSGGPLVGLDGKVAGINTAIRTNSGGSQGVGLAISSNVARHVVDKLRKDGTVRRGYLGVQVQQLDPDIAGRLGVENKTGVVVARVLGGSPAARAGIHAGDVLVSVAGTAIKTPAELQQRVIDWAPGNTATVTVMRDGKAVDLSVVIDAQPDGIGPRTIVPNAAPNVASGRSGARSNKLGIEWADRGGVVIERVAPGSLAANAGLRSGTVVTKIDTTSVQSVAEADAALQTASLEQGILLQLRHPDGAAGYVMLKSNLGS